MKNVEGGTFMFYLIISSTNPIEESVLLQLKCPLEPHIFIGGVLLDNVLNWQKKPRTLV
jgi:hypothetical protein